MMEAHRAHLKLRRHFLPDPYTGEWPEAAYEGMPEDIADAVAAVLSALGEAGYYADAGKLRDVDSVEFCVIRDEVPDPRGWWSGSVYVAVEMLNDAAFDLAWFVLHQFDAMRQSLLEEDVTSAAIA